SFFCYRDYTCLPSFPTRRSSDLQIVSSSGYLSSQVFVGCMFLAGAASTLALRSWKISEIENKARAEQEQSPRKDFWLTPRRLFRSEEHTSELQSRFDLVCRLLLE